MVLLAVTRLAMTLKWRRCYCEMCRAHGDYRELWYVESSRPLTLKEQAFIQEMALDRRAREE